MKITRRALGKIAAVGAFVASPAPSQAPPSGEPGATRGLFRSASQEIAAVKLPRTTEPATRFEA